MLYIKTLVTNRRTNFQVDHPDVGPIDSDGHGQSMDHVANYF
jgi:hypothetical protein